MVKKTLALLFLMTIGFVVALEYDNCEIYGNCFPVTSTVADSGSNFSGLFTDLDFTGTTGFDDFVDNDSGSITEIDPFWTANFSAYNDSWSLDTDTTYTAGVGLNLSSFEFSHRDYGGQTGTISLNGGLTITSISFDQDGLGHISDIVTGYNEFNYTNITDVPRETRLTPSRVFNTTYFNNRSTSIYVEVDVWFNRTGNGFDARLIYYAGTSPTPAVIGGFGQPTLAVSRVIADNFKYTTGFWVMPQEYYKIESRVGGTNTVSLDTWREIV